MKDFDILTLFPGTKIFLRQKQKKKKSLVFSNIILDQFADKAPMLGKGGGMVKLLMSGVEGGEILKH